jgi:hypothetical protein
MSADSKKLHSMEGVRGSNPLSSTKFRTLVQRLSDYWSRRLPVSGGIAGHGDCRVGLRAGSVGSSKTSGAETPSFRAGSSQVDGAFGLWARADPSCSYLTSGLDDADSWATDPHKWRNVPYDCGVALVRARQVEVWAVLRALGRPGVTDLIARTCGHAQAMAVFLRLRTCRPPIRTGHGFAHPGRAWAARSAAKATMRVAACPPGSRSVL